MLRIQEVIFRTEVKQKANVAKKRFEIFSGALFEPSKIASLYNSPIKLEDPRMKINQEHVVSRLEKDPLSVLVGVIESDFSNPVSLINVIKIALDNLNENFPKNQQELTGNETYSTTDPDNANTWVCPWVVVDEKVSQHGYRANVNKGQKSLSQLHVMVVGLEAAKRRIRQVVAFTRPFYARDFLASEEKSQIICIPDEKNESLDIRNAKGKRYFVDEGGVYSGDVHNRTYCIMWDNYYYYETSGKNKYDGVIGMHMSNGAEPCFVRPYGQIYDLPSLGVRLGFVYLL